MKSHPLRKFCELISIQVDPTAHADKTYLGLEHIATARFLRIGSGQASDVQSSKFIFQQGDVLYSKLRPYLDKAILADCEGVCTTELLVLRPNSDIDPRFLLCILHSPNFIHHALSGVSGAQHPRTSWHRIAEFEIPDFTIQDQTAISAIVWQIQDALRISEKLIKTAETFKSAIMHELFTRGLQGETQKETELGFVPKSWNILSIKDLGQIITGTTPPTQQKENYTNGQIPFISPGDMEHGSKIKKTEKHITQIGLAASRPLPKFSTCFVCIGSTIGKVGITTHAITATNQQINAIIPSEKYLPFYLFYLLTWWSNYIRSQASPSPVPILSKGAFEAIKIYTTSDLKEQTKIVQVLEAIDEKIDIHKRKQSILEDLFKSLLHRLMTGEIRASELDLSVLEKSADAVGASV